MVTGTRRGGERKLVFLACAGMWTRRGSWEPDPTEPKRQNTGEHKPVFLGAWDVSAVTSMSSMFLSNSAFNQPLGDWDVSSVAHTHTY